MKPVPFRFERAGDLKEALSLLSSATEEARPYAGGQSLGPMLNLRLARPELLVDLSSLEELRKVVEDQDGLTVGAMTVSRGFRGRNSSRRCQRPPKACSIRHRLPRRSKQGHPGWQPGPRRSRGRLATGHDGA